MSRGKGGAGGHDKKNERKVNLRGAVVEHK